jgi:hypothetical protein
MEQPEGSLDFNAIIRNAKTLRRELSLGWLRSSCRTLPHHAHGGAKAKAGTTCLETKQAVFVIA